MVVLSCYGPQYLVAGGRSQDSHYLAAGEMTMAVWQKIVSFVPLILSSEWN